MKKALWISLISIFVIVSIDRFTIDSAIGSFRIIHFFVFFIFLVNFLSIAANSLLVLKLLGSYVTFTIVYIYFIYGPSTLLYSFYSKGTISLILGQWFNILIFLTVYYLLIRNKNQIYRLGNVFYYIVIINCILVFFQFLFAYLGYVSVADPGDGLLGVGRPTIFFLDPNWIGYYLILNYWCLIWYYHLGYVPKHKINLVHIYLFCALLLIQSRVTLAFFIFSYFLFFVPKEKRYKSIFFFIVILFLVVIFFNIPYLISKIPSNLYYDIIDLDRNPRLLDFFNLYNEIEYYSRQMYGFGWGALPFISDFYPWRNYSGTVNVLPLQIYFDFGLVGVVTFSILFFFSIFRYKSNFLRTIFILFVIFNTFHSSVYKQFFWVYIALFIYFNRNVIEQSKN